MSVSGFAPLASVALANVLQKEAKSGSLIRCQTWASGAAITEDSDTEVEVGMREVILLYLSLLRRYLYHKESSTKSTVEVAA